MAVSEGLCKAQDTLHKGIARGRLAIDTDEDMPDDLRHAIEIGYTVEAHNVAFERGIWQNVMVPKYGWILPKDEQWRDTMARL